MIHEILPELQLHSNPFETAVSEQVSQSALMHIHRHDRTKGCSTQFVEASVWGPSREGQVMTWAVA